jgi:hypothetical protein
MDWCVYVLDLGGLPEGDPVGAVLDDPDQWTAAPTAPVLALAAALDARFPVGHEPCPWVTPRRRPEAAGRCLTVTFRPEAMAWALHEVIELATVHGMCVYDSIVGEILAVPVTR